MSRILNQRLQEEVPQRLAELLGVPRRQAKVERQPAAAAAGMGKTNVLVSVGGSRFVVQSRTSGQAASVLMAVRSVRAFADESKKKPIPLVAVPYMGQVGQQLCQEAKVSWLDLSGNARLFGPPGLHVHIEGKPNRFKRLGRPRSLFAPKSARIARWLLMEPDRAFTQRELARIAGLDEGFTSRVVRALEQHRLIARDAGGAVKAAEYSTVLDAWREAYDFSKHHIVRGLVAARTSDDVVRQLGRQLRRGKVDHAITGLAGAWLFSQFAGFRLVVFYVAQLPSAEACQEMGFHEEARGENVWLVVPNDEGVFHGASEREGIRCVHPVQLYLDLKDHPERSAEAAEQLRRKLLGKVGHA